MEFAISLSFLILLAIGVADFGRLYVVALATANAAKPGAQYGAQTNGTSGNAAEIEQAARDDAGNVGLQSVTSTQVFVQVRTTNTVSFAFRYPGLPQSVPVIRTVTLRVQ